MMRFLAPVLALALAGLLAACQTPGYDYAARAAPKGSASDSTPSARNPRYRLAAFREPTEGAGARGSRRRTGIVLLRIILRLTPVQGAQPSRRWLPGAPPAPATDLHRHHFPRQELP